MGAGGHHGHHNAFRGVRFGVRLGDRVGALRPSARVAPRSEHGEQQHPTFPRHISTTCCSQACDLQGAGLRKIAMRHRVESDRVESDKGAADHRASCNGIIFCGGSREGRVGRWVFAGMTKFFSQGSCLPERSSPAGKNYAHHLQHATLG